MTRSEVWRALGGTVVQIPPSTTLLEAKLESWIEENPSILGALLVIGRQVKTDVGGRIDLLAMDALGNLHVIELKRDRASALVVSQVLSYGAWIERLVDGDVHKIFRRYRKNASLNEAFSSRFGSELPEQVNVAQHYVIVAVEVDQATEDSVQVLTGQGFRIELVLFEHFEDRGADYVVRVTYAAPRSLRRRARARSSSNDPVSVTSASPTGTPAEGEPVAPGRSCFDHAHPHMGKSCTWSASEAGIGSAAVVAVVKKPERTIASLDEEVDGFWTCFYLEFTRDFYAYKWLYVLYLDWAKNNRRGAPLLRRAFVKRLRLVATASGEWIDNRARPAVAARSYEPLMERVPDSLPVPSNVARRGLRRMRRALEPALASFKAPSQADRAPAASRNDGCSTRRRSRRPGRDPRSQARCEPAHRHREPADDEARRGCACVEHLLHSLAGCGGLRGATGLGGGGSGSWVDRS